MDEVLRLHARLSRTARRARVRELFDRVGISEPDRVFAAYPHEYSGGMKQRVMIAMAIANRPRLIIADEPTTALDATVQASIIELLRDLQRESGTAIIFVNHDLAVVHEIADEVVVMQHGVVVERGSRAAVYSAPRHPYTRRLLAASALHAIDTTARNLTGSRGPVTGGEEDRLLEVEGLTKSYRRGGRRRKLVVEGISFQIHKGEILALVGESGSGKSTIGKVIAGLQFGDSGSVRLGGTELPTSYSDAVPRLPPELRRSVQMVFQDSYSSLNPRRRVRDSIVAPLRSLGADRSTCEASLAEVVARTGISLELLGRFPSQLSGGQRQRVAIARALTLRPDLIVADESIAALDVTAQQEIVELIGSMRDQDRTSFLFITHDLGVVRQLADRVVVLSPDGVQDDGSPQRVFEHPGSDYTRRLVAAVPRITTRAS